jgi:chromosomal replication initiation ATPase DnaA
MYKTTPECERIVNEAIELAISIYGVTREQIIAKDRDLYASEARQAAMMFADNEGLSRTKIGTLMQRDHTTVSYGIRQAKKRLKVAR